ncbi:hypothetical protein NM154_0024 [Enterococcus faecalis]|nr:hypothetical protein NM154_0024 [Enterococcus faecalis]
MYPVSFVYIPELSKANEGSSLLMRENTIFSRLKSSKYQ